MTMKETIKYGALTVLGVCLFKMASEYALRERGYFAVGGEIFLLLLPVFYYLLSEMADSIRDDLGDVWKELKKR